jgi:segregation and condensation protein A
METDFKVRVGEFEGPLELVLELVEKRKLHISDVSLSEVADEYISHIKSFEKFPVADSADFILVASTLLLIKSKSLLPNMPLTEEEQVSIEDLENRLIAYQKHKELAADLEKIFGHFLYFAKESKYSQVIFSPSSNITALSLRDILEEVLVHAPKKEENLTKVVVQKMISLEEMVEKLSEKLRASLKTSFKEFSRQNKSGLSGMSREDRVNVIVSFLAMLELVKQGMVRASQNNHFDDIEMESENTGVPIYS